MRFAFDLWSHEDVAQHAEAIIERLQAGTMPVTAPLRCLARAEA
jgi:hypothetical protein